MGEPTMEKSDVKLEYDPISGVDWAEIQKVCGRAAPQTAKALHAEVLKKLKNKEIKKPYAKVGLVKGSMYLRYKDGTSHLGDVLLAKDWTAPVGDAPLDNKTKKILDEFIESRKELQQTVSTGKAIIKQYATQIEFLLGEMNQMVKDAQALAKKGGSPDESLVPEGNKRVVAANKLKLAAHRQMDDNVFPIFDEHRTITKPEGVDATLIGNWGKAFYLTVGTEYTKTSEYLKACDTATTQIEQAKASLDRLVGKIDDANTSLLASLGRARDMVDSEYEAMKDCLNGTRSIDQFETNMKGMDLANVQRFFDEGKPDLALASADSATVKAQKAGANFKLMQKHHDKLQQIAKGVEKIKVPGGDPIMKEIAKTVGDAKNFAASKAKILKGGLELYADLRKLLSAKGQKAA